MALLDWSVSIHLRKALTKLDHRVLIGRPSTASRFTSGIFSLNQQGPLHPGSKGARRFGQHKSIDLRRASISNQFLAHDEKPFRLVRSHEIPGWQTHQPAQPAAAFFLAYKLIAATNWLATVGLLLIKTDLPVLLRFGIFNNGSQ
jgi:hypothetical protein